MIFSGNKLGITPNNATGPNWTLESPSSGQGQLLYIKEFNCGGNVTTSTNMQTSWKRDSTLGAGTRTSVTPAQLDRQINTSFGNGAFFLGAGGYATSQPSTTASPLWGTNWNANGGVIRVLLAPDEEIIQVGSASISCYADSGTASSNYGVIWREP